jgi:hypothetical protein
VSISDAARGPKWLELLHDVIRIATAIAAHKASTFITFFGAIGAYLFLNT